jgi:hypothetical protein
VWSHDGKSVAFIRIYDELDDQGSSTRAAAFGKDTAAFSVMVGDPATLQAVEVRLILAALSRLQPASPGT